MLERSLYPPCKNMKGKTSAINNYKTYHTMTTIMFITGTSITTTSTNSSDTALELGKLAVQADLEAELKSLEQAEALAYHSEYEDYLREQAEIQEAIDDYLEEMEEDIYFCPDCNQWMY